MKQYRLVKVGEHYVALSRANVKTQATLEMIKELTQPFAKGDKIRKMNDEDLAWLLLEFRFDAYNKAKGGEAAFPSSQADIVKWLKEDA